MDKRIILYVAIPLFVVLVLVAARDLVAPPESTNGQVLYQRLCALCHGADGRGYGAPASPALANPNFLAIADEVYLFENTTLGRPGTRMSAWGKSLSDAQIRAIVDYIREWRTKPRVDVSGMTVEGDATRGAALYEDNCAVCHGEDGGGLDESSRAPNGAPSLNNPVFLDTASDGFIRYSIAEGRPGTPMEAYAGALTDQEIDDLVAFIRSWQQ